MKALDLCFRSRWGRRIGKGVLALGCLVPSLVAYSKSSTAEYASRPALVRAENPLAMHIHLVHLREFDLREGRAIARYEFHNAGTQPLKIKQIKPSCGCVTTRLNQAETGFKPGASGEFYLELDTAAESSGTHDFQVKIDYDVLHGDHAEAGSQEVRFRVDVPDRKVAIRPRALIFYQMTAEETTQTVEITDFRSGHELKLVSQEVQGEFLSAGEPRLEFNEHGQRVWKLDVTAAGNVPIGRYSSTLFLETNDAEFPEIRLPVLIFGPRPQTAAAPDAAQPAATHTH